MILRGIKRTALLGVAAAALTACTTQVPGGETGPFAAGNTLTFFYQSVLTDPPDQAQVVSCGNEFVTRSCAVLSNGASFPIEATETGVSFGNATQRIVLQLDESGLPSGIGQLTNSETGDVQGMRWVSLAS